MARSICPGDDPRNPPVAPSPAVVLAVGLLLSAPLPSALAEGLGLSTTYTLGSGDLAPHPSRRASPQPRLRRQDSQRPALAPRPTRSLGPRPEARGRSARREQDRWRFAGPRVLVKRHRSWSWGWCGTAGCASAAPVTRGCPRQPGPFASPSWSPARPPDLGLTPLPALLPSCPSGGRLESASAPGNRRRLRTMRTPRTLTPWDPCVPLTQRAPRPCCHARQPRTLTRALH